MREKRAQRKKNVTIYRQFWEQTMVIGHFLLNRQSEIVLHEDVQGDEIVVCFFMERRTLNDRRIIVNGN